MYPSFLLEHSRLRHKIAFIFGIVPPVKVRGSGHDYIVLSSLFIVIALSLILPHVLARIQIRRLRTYHKNYQRVIGTHPMEMRPPCFKQGQFSWTSAKTFILARLLFSQQTGLALQAEPLPTPTTSMGEQDRPTRPVRSLRTTPSRPKIALAESELACGHTFSIGHDKL